jgi:hypothetical protein
VSGAANRVQRGEERGLRPLLVDRTATAEDLAEPGLVDDLAIPRRRLPFRGVDLLDVVHEVEAERVARTGIERREDARMAIGRDALGLLEPRVGREFRHQCTALFHAEVLGGNRGLVDPLAQPVDRLGVTPLDLAIDVVAPGGCHSLLCSPQRGPAADDAAHETTSRQIRHDPLPFVVRRP